MAVYRIRLNKVTVWPPVVILLTGALGFLIVSLLSIEPLYGLMAIIGLLALVAILILHPTLPHLYLSLLGLTLIGYALLGKGFAYFGKTSGLCGRIRSASRLHSFCIEAKCKNISIPY